MKCPSCGNRDGGCEQNKKSAKFFFINLRSNFEQYSNVPCYVRKYINKETDDVLPVRTVEDDIYMFDLTKLESKTRIHGTGYNKFLENYNMNQKEEIRFDMEEDKPYITITPLDTNGFPKEIHQEQFDFQKEASVVVFSGGLELSSYQMAKLNMCVQERGIGIGPIYVHCLTKSDIENNGMRIPKLVASFLPIKRSGEILLVKDEVDEQKVAMYYTSTDGRICFKYGWEEFVAANELKVGQTVLVMFDWGEDVISMSFDIMD